jgi:hypothetical protein
MPICKDSEVRLVYKHIKDLTEGFDKRMVCGAPFGQLRRYSCRLRSGRKRLEISSPVEVSSTTHNSERPNSLRHRAVLGSGLRNPSKQSSSLPPKGYIAICKTSRSCDQVKDLAKTVKSVGVSAVTTRYLHHCPSMHLVRRKG